MREMVNSMWRWRAAFVRCVIYMLVVTGTTWTAATDGYSKEAWEELSQNEFWRLVIMAVCAGLGTVVAFLDKTLAEETPPVKPNV